ncbi:hypothetical protein [Phragmitibacter flavus]|uniref:hypothetical protein n=1 Tax=Phragmitibacter flavus TaxID=2576071 RepID=UPI0014087B70|nr:hypothetical protein [Phragmitibacter flavus]
MITSIRKTISNKPWLWIVLAFLVLITVWTCFITIAVNNQPEKIPLPTPHVDADASH